MDLTINLSVSRITVLRKTAVRPLRVVTLDQTIQIGTVKGVCRDNKNKTGEKNKKNRRLLCMDGPLKYS